MATVLSCVALVATVGRSVSAKIASTGVVLICQVIALPFPFHSISSPFSIAEIKTHDSHAAAVYSTVDLSVAM